MTTRRWRIHQEECYVDWGIVEGGESSFRSGEDSDLEMFWERSGRWGRGGGTKQICMFQSYKFKFFFFNLGNNMWWGGQLVPCLIPLPRLTRSGVASWLYILKWSIGMYVFLEWVVDKLILKINNTSIPVLEINMHEIFCQSIFHLKQ